MVADLEISLGVFFIFTGLFSNKTISDPSFENSFAIAKPIAPHPPLITVIFPVKLALFSVFNFACSKGQYSTLKISFSGIETNFPKDSALDIISMVHSAKSEAIEASFFDLPIPIIPTSGININLGFPSNSVGLYKYFLFRKKYL